ncbi:hypothetical protein [Microbacterium sp. PAMC22086]|uniref:hypothetical protein n=1 Tax=Microbacterium sp. PAMC22086 TaxID=2861281 RepID=UPI001C628E26|nr:hypothetical protein [Microbacterium sp. PAMC22086]QYG11527.1 hypothetical protein KY497_14930 [Microbacterium sp. PAMC22086]
MRDPDHGIVERLLARIDPGWPPLIDVSPGWLPILGRLDHRLAAIAPRYTIQQVKSKFGALTFYARPISDPYGHVEEFDVAIEEAQWESTTTCEKCGGEGAPYVINLWVWTLCPRDADLLNARADGSGSG